MAAKPTIALARFADGVGADKTAPAGGLRDTGFVGGSTIAEDFVNELFFQSYSWALYLNDGALTGNHTIAGTLGVSGALTASVGLQVRNASSPSFFVGVSSPAALAASYTITLPLAPPPTTLPMSMSSTGVITTASALGALPCTLLLARIDASASFILGGTASANGVPRISLGTSTGTSNLPVFCYVGQTIASWSVSFVKTSASGTIQATLWRSPVNGSIPATQIGTTKTNSANNPGVITLGDSGLTETVTSANSYFIEVKGGGVTGDLVTGYTVTPI